MTGVGDADIKTCALMSISFNTGGIVSSSSLEICGDNPARQEYIIPEEFMKKITGDIGIEEGAPFQIISRSSYRKMIKQIEALKQSRWVYLLIGALIGFVGTLLAIAVALID